MSHILEIPVIHLLDDPEKDFINAVSVYSDRSYRGFRHIVYQVDEERFIYFYILDKQEDHFTQSVWERIIPKAPFTVFLFEEKNTFARELIEQYKQKYSTPYFIFIPSADGIKKGFQSVDQDDAFYFNSLEENGFIKALLDALKKYDQISETKTT